MKEIKIFDKVSCRGFYTKAYDGNYIALDRTALKADAYNSNSDQPIEEDIDMMEKTYFRHVKHNFRGVVVGKKDIVISGYLDVCYDDAVDVGVGVIPERFYISKRAKETKSVYIVYYANNRKHYVSAEDIAE